MYGSYHANRQLRLIEQDALASKAGQVFEAIVARVTADLGGPDALTEIEKHLVMSFAGAALLQGRQLSRILKGAPVNPHEYVSVAYAMVRASKRLGTSRRMKEAAPSLSRYLQTKGTERTEAKGEE